MATAIASAHAERIASPASVKRPIWQCQEPGCDGSRIRDSDGINWTCKKCKVGTNKDKPAETKQVKLAKPVLVSSKPVERSEPSPRWLDERRIAGARTCSSRR
ncbi:hypothetical protein A2419_03545 [Candidatus Adlerbacteria bacterium RIFOXYC1_FULL_48_26]|uniref:Uncharacterized protein n=1 Tax=Candidatus Adlerbacteria bacterium RIFOXYC1_FULL_48_26 TaxID=1797247 RepID=A0A1F4Y4C9_9BACT|nr:MAG: hypothetical protein A2419_03545 [Candidatus Adlerbacteria bacterium RIFOXYC1_FULL_48_26]